ncbi:MAG: hypothetical protein KC502_07970 [Myxococcales bacterium]|nr:hypothetical protein [Myxococcales bacterium]
MSRLPDLPPITLPASPSMASALALHAGLHLRRSLKLRRMFPALLLIALVVAAGAGIARVSAGQPLALLTFLSTLGVRAVGLIALGMGTRALRADADHGALSAFLLRPRAAVALPIGRLFATIIMVSTLAVFMAVAVQGAALAVALPVEWARMPYIICGYVLASVGYTALFMLFASLLRPAAAIGLAWLVLIDLGLGNLSDRLGRLTPGPSAASIVNFDPDLSLWGSAGLDLWFSVLSIVVLTVMCAGITLWRFRGDVPE